MKKFLITLAVVLVGLNVMAATTRWKLFDGDAIKGTAKIVSDDAGTATLTVDAVAATITGDVTGDLTGDDITANGSITDTLGINLDPTSDTNVLGTVSINGGRASAEVQDNDYFTLDLYVGNDGLAGTETNTEVYASIKVTTTDVTGGTEDSKIEIYTVANGTETEAIELLADDVTIADDLTVTGDVGAANVTATAAVYGATVGFSAATGYFAVLDTTNLVFIASSGSVTNVIDADIGTP